MMRSFRRVLSVLAMMLTLTACTISTTSTPPLPTSPKTVAALNGQEVKIVKVKGEFPWHHHANEDEFFMVWKGKFRVEFRDRVVTL